MSTTAIDNTEIKYDRITRDYAVLVDGLAVTYGRTYSEAEAKRTAYLAEQVPESACAGFGCVDGCGDCALDPPGDNPMGDDEGDELPDSRHHRLAVNRVIVNVHASLHIPCQLCAGDHLTQHCPSIRALLFAEPVVMVLDVEHTPVGWAV